jgi:hypothetical protein
MAIDLLVCRTRYGDQPVEFAMARNRVDHIIDCGGPRLYQFNDETAGDAPLTR